MNPTAYALVLLTELPRIGERGAARIVNQLERDGLRAEEILHMAADTLRLGYGMPAPAVARLCGDRNRHELHCRDVLARIEAVNGAVLGPGDEDYPAGWRYRLDPPPPLVYLYGCRAALAGSTLALLSSRFITERTVTATVRLVQAVAREGFTLVTGGMKSTHRIAAATVRAAAAPRVVVLDRGLFAAFGAHFDRDPFGLGPGRGGFDPARTLVLSPFRPYDHAAPGNGRRRDELIAALADIVVAVSARPGGEIERICMRALDRGQSVLCWHGENGALTAAGATPIDEGDLGSGLARFAGRT